MKMDKMKRQKKLNNLLITNWKKTKRSYSYQKFMIKLMNQNMA
jgi:hypothetical protein